MSANEEAALMLEQLFAFAKRGDTAGLSAQIRALGRAAVKRADQLGNTPLHYAAAGGYEDACVALLEAGAAIDARNAVGQTPLHRAAARAHAGPVALLVQRGADVHASDAEGQTPRDLCNDHDVSALLLPPGTEIDIGGDDESEPEQEEEEEDD